eukprot:TRINITY_DN3802_c0_g3_i2.p1 TRINITY_DN3802_c0_g3~~TRINITY_DN3802_c0_g3_i2.p1  ORF type:complete len:309 (-),score=46.55 TRINITY_DN3802_c0_g3_i2:47-973(-)
MIGKKQKKQASGGGFMSRLFGGKKAAPSTSSEEDISFPTKYTYKITLMGPECTGKTSLAIRYAQDLFYPEYDPTIEERHVCTKKWNDKSVSLDLLDTAGQEKFASLRDESMRRGGGYVIGYSIVNRESFERIHDFYDQLLAASTTPAEHMAIVLVGNKTDLEQQRSVSTAEGVALAEKWGVPFFETSALANEHVDECFEELGRWIDMQDTVPSSRQQTLQSPNGSVYTGTVVETPTGVTLVPYLRGVATYTSADNALFGEYNGGWRCGRKHGNGTLRLRSTTTTHAGSGVVLVGRWLDGRLVEGHCPT